jgi:hypothetical protein
VLTTIGSKKTYALALPITCEFIIPLVASIAHCTASW